MHHGYYTQDLFCLMQREGNSKQYFTSYFDYYLYPHTTTCCLATAQIMTMYPIWWSHNFNSLPSQEMSLQFSPITTPCKPDSDRPFLFLTNERVKPVISISLAIEQITVIWLISLRPSYTDFKNKGIQFLPPQQNLASSLTLFVYFLHGFDIPLYNTLLWKSLSKGRK